MLLVIDIQVENFIKSVNYICRMKLGILTKILFPCAALHERNRNSGKSAAILTRTEKRDADVEDISDEDGYTVVN